MFSFGRRKKFDKTGRILIVDSEAPLQRIDEDNRSKPERKKQVRKFITSLKPKGDRNDGEKFLQIMLERQKQLKLSFEEIDLNKDGVGTRQQHQIVPENMFEMIGKIWRIDGWRGFYFGSLPNLIKVLPASTVAYLTFEYFSSLFDING